MGDPAVIPGIPQARGRFFGEAVTLVNLPENQTADIRGNYPAGKIGDDPLEKQASKT